MTVLTPAPVPSVDLRVDRFVEAPEPLPLPAPGWGAAQALEALAEARLTLPHLPEATLVSVLTTVVMRAGDLAVKVYPPGTDAGHLERIRTEVSGTRAAVTPCSPPVTTSVGVVAVAPWLTVGRPVGWRQLGGLLRRFHADTDLAELPPWQPLRRLPSQVAGLDPDLAEVFLDARRQLLTALECTTSVLGYGVIHGDVSPANAMYGPRGPVLIDLDFAAHGPREYDLASAARRCASGELDRFTYRQFCRAYGFDVRGWDGLTLLDRVAELGGVAFALWDSRQQGLDVEWAGQAAQRWRTPL